MTIVWFGLRLVSWRGEGSATLGCDTDLVKLATLYLPMTCLADGGVVLENDGDGLVVTSMSARLTDNYVVEFGPVLNACPVWSGEYCSHMVTTVLSVDSLHVKVDRSLASSKLHGGFGP